MKASLLLFFCFSALYRSLFAQNPETFGRLISKDSEEVPAFGEGLLLPSGKRLSSDEKGKFLIPDRTTTDRILIWKVPGFEIDTLTLHGKIPDRIWLSSKSRNLEEVVVSGNLRPVQRKHSIQPIEVFTPQLFRKAWTPGLMESVSMINGVQAQINCNVCSAGDIHINGLEGPYTLILIDGMPMVSSLSSVYGLFGIPKSLIRRLEVVRGPASTLYGSEAMAGLINVITKDPESAPKAFADFSVSSLGEYNVDASTQWKAGAYKGFLGINGNWFDQKRDINRDGFTDLALQKRLSVFSKWDRFHPKRGTSSTAIRLFAENRWGGQLSFSRRWVGTDSIYGESIQTRRVELFGRQGLDPKGKLRVDYAWNLHQQDSWYGIHRFFATQQNLFVQGVWQFQSGPLHLVSGIPIRFQHYDDNTAATRYGTQAETGLQRYFQPGIFSQAEWNFSKRAQGLAGLRLDFHPSHGKILTPRLGFRYQLSEDHSLRSSFGTGFRVVQLFSEDHAALSGSRQVVIQEQLNPEKSANLSLGYLGFFSIGDFSNTLEMNVFYTHFQNQIVGDFISDPNKILYRNLNGFGISQGINASWEIRSVGGFSGSLGLTVMDVYRIRDGKRETQLFAPPLSGNLTLSYARKGWNLDVTGKINGPMKLPVVPEDFRPEWSPIVPMMQFQASKTLARKLEFRFGLRNILNFLPANPILRPFDPFDKRIDQNNPNGYTFDANYSYAPMTGTSVFVGLKWEISGSTK